MDNIGLTKIQEGLKPTIKQLMEDQLTYDPFKDNDYLEQGSFLLSKLANAKKEIENQRLAFTKPLNESLKSINIFFKTFSEPIEQADRELRDKLAKHRRELEYQRLEEQMKRDEENKRLAKLAEESGKSLIVQPSLPEVPDLNSKIGAVVVKKVWTFKVENKEAVPNQYLDINEVKIRAAINSGIREISGIIIYQEDRVSL